MNKKLKKKRTAFIQNRNRF